MDTTSEIKFECGKCEQRILVDGTAAGMSATCPSCHAHVTVPKEGRDHIAKRQREGYRRAGGAGPLRGISDTEEDYSDPETGALRQELIEASTEITRSEAELTTLRAQL